MFRPFALGALFVTAVLGGASCGCGSSPSVPPCQGYVACYEATGGTKGSLDRSYGAMGTCWTTTYAAADACEIACARDFEALKKAYPDAGCMGP